MRFTPRPPEIGENDGFGKSDIFNVKPFGERLALIVEQSDEPLVIAIDGPWGSGKSVFAKQWAGLLRQRRTPVIEFDAFANDYQEDAFIALATEIIAYAKKVNKGEDAGIVRGFIETAAKVGRAIAPTAVKVALRAVTLGAFSSEDGRDLEQAVEAAAADTGQFVEKELLNRLNKAESTASVMKNFGEALSGLAKTLAEWEKPDEQAVKPRLVVIIDELDRCKPSFALDLLEKIKHFYNVDGVNFVLVTYLTQIEAAVQGRYGANTDAAAYLQKFISMRFRWNPQHGKDVTRGAHYVETCLTAIGTEVNDHLKAYFKTICNRAGVSLRTVEHILSNLLLFPNYFTTSGRDSGGILSNILFVFICLREIGLDVRDYENKSQFVSECYKIMQLDNLDTLSDHYEKSLRACVSVLFIEENDNHIQSGIRSNLLAHGDMKGIYRHIERLLNGEAVG